MSEISLNMLGNLFWRKVLEISSKVYPYYITNSVLIPTEINLTDKLSSPIFWFKFELSLDILNTL
jgi:hypothetical protein